MFLFAGCFGGERSLKELVLSQCGTGKILAGLKIHFPPTSGWHSCCADRLVHKLGTAATLGPMVQVYIVEVRSTQSMTNYGRTAVPLFYAYKEHFIQGPQLALITHYT